MTKRTRLFLSIAAGILIVGLGTGLVASYADLQNLVLVGRDGPDELAYLPPDANAIAYADVREVMNSELRRKLEGVIGDNPQSARQKFQEATGVDLEADIDHVVAAVSHVGEKGDHPLVVVQGRFDTVRIEGAIREHNGQVEEYGGKRVLTFTEGDQHVALAFAEPGLIVLGPLAAVQGALDRKSSGGQSIKNNDDVMRIVRDVDNGNAWAVARFDTLTGGAPLPPEIASKLPAITWLSVSGVIDSGVRGVVRAEARDDASAENLRDVIRGMMALVRLQTGSQPALAELVNSLQLSGQGKSVALEFALPGEIIDAIGAMHAQRLREQPPPPEAPDLPEAPLPPPPPVPPPPALE